MIDKISIESLFLEEMQNVLTQKKYVESKDKISIKFKELVEDFKKMDVEHNSPYLESMEESLQYLAAYFILKDYLELDKIILLVHGYYEKKLKSMGCLELECTRKSIFDQNNIKMMEKTALESQRRKFTEDYIVYFIRGDGVNYTFGNDTTQCPIYLFFKKHKALEFLQCICDIDFIRSRYIKTGLVRNQCLSKGDNCCSFRWNENQ